MMLAQIGVALFVAGFIAVILGVALIVIYGFRAARHRVGGAVLVGPFPIIFGDRSLVKYSLALLVLMVILVIIAILLPLILVGRVG
ncbi:MAG: DUF131 domain-containing protein [Candidatus Bathyarchaeia archaeon]